MYDWEAELKKKAIPALDKLFEKYSDKNARPPEYITPKTVYKNFSEPELPPSPISGDDEPGFKDIIKLVRTFILIGLLVFLYFKVYKPVKNSPGGFNGSLRNSQKR